MTNDPEHVVPAADTADMASGLFAEQANYVARAAALHPANKTALFDALAAAGITSVVVVFDGSGDSGQIEDITFHANDSVVSAPVMAPIPIQSTYWGSTEIRSESMTIDKAIEQLAYDFLAQAHSGWENNDGAYGEFTFDVGLRTITLEYNERYTTIETFQHTF